MSFLLKAGFQAEEGLTYNLIKLFFPFFTGLLILNVLVAYMNPKLTVYTQGSPSVWQTYLTGYTILIYSLLSFISGFFIYAIPLYKIGLHIGQGNMGSVYLTIVPVIVINILFGLLSWFFASFQKWGYNTVGFGENDFKYCKIDETAKDNMNQTASTCKWTKWQSFRDTVCFTFSSFFNELTFYSNRFLYGNNIPFYNLYFWIILAGILKSIF